MDASRLLRPAPPPLLLRSAAGRSAHRTRVPFFRRRRRGPLGRVPLLAAGGDAAEDGAPPDAEGKDSGSGEAESVDGGMPTLWKRIGELKEEEEEGLHQRRGTKELLPVELSRLELAEDSCTLYRSDVLEVLGLLQLRPDGERVKVDMGVTVMVKLLLPASVLVVMLHLMDAAKVILDGMKQKS